VVNPSSVLTVWELVLTLQEVMLSICCLADATQLIPDGLSYDQAAPIFCAGYTTNGNVRFKAVIEPNR
jgi:hypothetical protein